MGLISFLKDIGKKLTPGREAEEIEKEIRDSLAGQVQNLDVDFADGKVTLKGTVKSQAAKEKAVLLAGNVASVSSVHDSIEVEAEFYTIQKGDSLSQIAKAKYGDPMKWEKLFEANKEVIKDPDLIYPGQQIRIPAL